MTITDYALAKQQEAFLLAHGWFRRADKEPWSWYKPPLRGTFYCLRDAVDIEKARKEHHGQR